MADPFLERLDRRIQIVRARAQAEAAERARERVAAQVADVLAGRLELPADVDLAPPDSDSPFQFVCRACEAWSPMYWDLDEDHPDSHYCGRSPSCLP